ncbi:MAG TPA: ATP-grasp domain-containing protein, partial [Patescibacteria group bacterium]|nr:ATP-grasp domain-containing protein [Patescibacteria group bacterium]
KFILQFNRAHTGSGTILIESEKQIQELKQKFPNREVRVTQFIDGSAFTVNSVVWGNKVLVGNISYQITGLPPFTDQKFATIGNDWALHQRVLNSKQIKQFKQMATDIGKKLAKDGWKGLFGIDVIMDEKTRKLYLIEINARQPASTTYESQLQTHNTYHVTRNSKLMTTFEAHLAALLKLHDTGYVLREISSGSQIIQRVTSSTYKLPPTSYKLRKHFTLIPYPNTDPGKDLLRIQSKKGIMASHNEFNKTGEEIVSTLVTRPAWLNKIDPSFRWDSKKIWKLNLPTQQMDIKKLTWHLDLPFWEKEGTDDWNLTPREVIKNPEQQPTHYKKIINSDLRYPIAIMKLKGQWRVLDGLHRLAKAHMDGKKKMLVKIIDKRHAPSIAFDN